MKSTDRSQEASVFSGDPALCREPALSLISQLQPAVGGPRKGEKVQAIHPLYVFNYWAKALAPALTSLAKSRLFHVCECKILVKGLLICVSPWAQFPAPGEKKRKDKTG